VRIEYFSNATLRYVAVCCSVLQHVAVCCSVLQCVAVCCSVLQCVAVCCGVLQCVAARCSVLQCHEYQPTTEYVVHILKSHVSVTQFHNVFGTHSQMSPCCSLY